MSSHVKYRSSTIASLAVEMAVETTDEDETVATNQCSRRWKFRWQTTESSDLRPTTTSTSTSTPTHTHTHNQHPKHIHYTLSITPTHNIAPLSCLQAGCPSYHPPRHVNKCEGDFIFSFKLTFLTERCTNTQSRFQTKAQINYDTSLQQKQNNDNNTRLTALFPGLPR